MKDFRVTITVRNNLLLCAIEDAGYPSAKKFADAYRINYPYLIEYLALKRSPLRQDGTVTPSAELICDALRKNLEEIFPERFMERCLARNRLTAEMGEAELGSLVTGPDAAAQLVIESDARRLLDKALEDLSERSRSIVAMFYGLNGEPRMNLEEIGKLHNVSRERVRGIIMAAEAKLSHPKRSKALREALETLKIE